MIIKRFTKYGKIDYFTRIQVLLEEEKLIVNLKPIDHKDIVAY